MISFVVCALNEEKRIGECLDSIWRELLTTGVKAEIVVVDNGSSDDTALVARKHGATVIREPQRGLLKAKQAGYLQTKYPLIAFIDADCRLRRGWLLRVIDLLSDHKISAVSGPYRYFDIPWYWRLAADVVFAVYAVIGKFMPCMMGGNSVLRREILDKIGGFDSSIAFWGEDTWTAIEFAKHGRVKFDLGISVDSSGRRLKGDGYVRTFLSYLLNSFAVRWNGQPATQGQIDYR